MFISLMMPSNHLVLWGLLQSFPASGSFPRSLLFTSGSQSIGASVSSSVLQMNIQGLFPLDWLIWSLWSPKDSKESSPAPELESINSVLKRLCGPTLTIIHSYLKNHSWLYRSLSVKWCLCFLIYCLGFCLFACLFVCLFAKEQASFNFMAAVTILSDFGAQENKIYHCFHFYPIYLPSNNRTGCHDVRFWCWV